jgi:hypothetical protein
MTFHFVKIECTDQLNTYYQHQHQHQHIITNSPSIKKTKQSINNTCLIPTASELSCWPHKDCHHFICRVQFSLRLMHSHAQPLTVCQLKHTLHLAANSFSITDPSPCLAAAMLGLGRDCRSQARSTWDGERTGTNEPASGHALVGLEHTSSSLQPSLNHVLISHPT